jgi:hypothetical protein
MKYAVLLLILMGCSLAYLHSEQPDLWNQLVKSVGLPTWTVASPTSVASDSTADAPGTPGSVRPVQPELITPASTTYINPDHVHQVEQPSQPSASTNQPGNPPAQ